MRAYVRILPCTNGNMQLGITFRDSKGGGQRARSSEATQTSCHRAAVASTRFPLASMAYAEMPAVTGKGIVTLYSQACRQARERRLGASRDGDLNPHVDPRHGRPHSEGPRADGPLSPREP